MKKLKMALVIGFLTTITAFNANCQQTIGLQVNSTASYDGFTLFAPVSSETTYLINNCGEQVHSWVSNYKPRFSCYLMENGVLLRMGRVVGPNGGSGIVEMIDWDGVVIWSYAIPDTIGIQHHDMELLPSGNILLLITDVINQTEINQAGGTNTAASINSEKIIEIEPDIVNGGGTIVWEWSVWDHLIQDADNTKDNFGIVGDHPERVNINFLSPAAGNWLHFNAVDYHPEFDQIIVSSRNLSEFWIIDHSTTTSEAADTVGGLYGQGGDLLYRWGNPQSYDRGTAADQKLFRQHHPHWVTNSPTEDGKIIVFNNLAGTAFGQEYSNVNILTLPVNTAGFYAASTSAFSPNAFDFTYQGTPATSFYSAVVSGAEILPNGNKLICEGVPGHFFELDQNDNIVWEYINPVSDLGPQVQGSTISNNNVFRCTRYSPDYTGLVGKDLTPAGTIETGISAPCDLFALSVDEVNNTEVTVFPNPAHSVVSLKGLENYSDYEIKIVNMEGKIVLSTTDAVKIDLRDLIGIHFVYIYHAAGVITKKIMIL